MSITHLKDQVSIVDVASQFMTLTKRGKSYKALCPFHSEKTASFNVLESGRYRCFGCGASGDVVDLYAFMQGVNTAEAVRLLKSEYGVHGGQLSDNAKEMRREASVRKMRTDLRKTVLAFVNQFEELLRLIKCDATLDLYGGLYHEMSLIDLWLLNIEGCDYEELKRLSEYVPGYLEDVYERYTGG